MKREMEKSKKGRGAKVGDWRVRKLLSGVLGTSHKNAYTSFKQLMLQRGPLATYLLKLDEDTNLFGGLQH